ncbi:ABC transporter permease [Halobacteriales archaeon SW_7_71_33]|nr:MAG: ABC transporter permease [Halobacteriales archaeon SW_7_71_33]
MSTAEELGFGDTVSLRERVQAKPRPAIVWSAVATVLLLVEAAAVLEFAGSFAVDTVRALNGIRLLPFQIDPTGAVQFRQFAADLPRLLSRRTITAHGFYSIEAEQWVVGPTYYDGQRWVGTFMSLEPKHAWLLRFLLVYAYTAVGLAWIWTGYKWWRRHYRAAEWTPRDDVVDRFRSHSWGVLGMVIVLLFMTTVLFGPTMATTTNQVNNVDPYSYETRYYDADAESVERISIGVANSNTISDNGQTVGPWSYDQYGRFHPFGTMPGGQDLFTFVMFGARLSIIIGLVTVGLSTLLATTAAMVSAYFKGYVDLGMVLLSDAIFALPGLLLLIMLSVVLGNSWIAEVYDGGLLLALIFAGTGWPGLWRSIRGPALQIAERDWVDAAKAYGQRPSVVMRKHILPYITGYLLVYGSMSLGGIIIGIAGLSYLGLGIDPPAPEWGRAVSLGQPYIQGSSWHISIIPGLLVTVVVIGFNALGDGFRDAIDPESDAESADTGGAERGGGA